MTRFYLCAPYRRRADMLEYAGDLEALGHVVTSRWIKGNREALQLRLVHGPKLHAVRQEVIGENMGDLGDSEALINFSDGDWEADPRGTRHVELGIALALELDIIQIGPPENIFHQADFVARYPDWHAFIERLRAAALQGGSHV